MLKDFIVYDQKLREWDIKKILLVGSQGSGKTVFIRYFTSLVNSLYDKVLAISTNDIRIISDKRYINLFKGYDVIILIRDDAIGAGTDSRRAPSGQNVSTTSIFARSRHIMRKNVSPVGIIFTIFAVQAFKRLDPTIRDNVQLKIFTDYYEEKYFQDEFNEKQTEFFREKCYEGMFKSDFKQRAYAMAKSKYGRVATLEIPFVAENHVDIEVVDRSIGEDDLINDLRDHIINKIPNFYKKPLQS